MSSPSPTDPLTFLIDLINQFLKGIPPPPGVSTFTPPQTMPSPGLITGTPSPAPPPTTTPPTSPTITPAPAPAPAPTMPPPAAPPTTTTPPPPSPSPSVPGNQTNNYAVYQADDTLVVYSESETNAKSVADAVGDGAFVVAPMSNTVVYTSTATPTPNVTSDYYTSLSEGAKPSPLGPPWFFFNDKESTEIYTTTGVLA